MHIFVTLLETNLILAANFVAMELIRFGRYVLEKMAYHIGNEVAYNGRHG